MQNAFEPTGETVQSCTSAGIADCQEQFEKFLEKRGLELETAVNYGLSASDGVIDIPFIKNGERVNVKHRTMAEKKFWHDGGDLPLWNVDCLTDSSLSNEPVLITEGEFDALAAIQCGYVRTVSLPTGAQDNASFPYLEDVEAILRGCPEIILCTDGDEKGVSMREQLSIFLGKARCKWVKYPKGCKDLNDALMTYGERGVHKTIENAAWVHVEGVFSMSELPELPYRKPYSIGISGFDAHLNIRMADFSVWTGIPSHGKSTFVNDVCCRLAEKHGLKTCFASFEQMPQTDHKRALRTWHCGKLEKYMTDSEKAAADAWIDDSFRFIVPSDDDFTNLEWLFEKMAAAVIRHGINVIVIDPWNELDHDRPNGMTLTEYVGSAIRQFKAFAKKYAVHVMVVAHPAKMLRMKDGKYPVPTLYDISDSANWNNKADLGVVVHRDKATGDIIQVVKSRYHQEIGTPAIVDVKFSQETGRYTVVDNSVLYPE